MANKPGQPQPQPRPKAAAVPPAHHPAPAPRSAPPPRWLELCYRLLAVDRPTRKQRDRILGIAVLTAGWLALMWYFGVRLENATLQTLERQAAAETMVLSKYDRLNDQLIYISDSLAARRAALEKREAHLAPDRDTYAWQLQTINAFSREREGLAVESFSVPEISDRGFLPEFPYHWATFHMRGTGHYEQLGLFFADFENAFPYSRLQNPVMTPNTSPGAAPESLEVTFDIVTPLVPVAAVAAPQVSTNASPPR